MPSIGVHTDVERLQTRWVLGALGIAFAIHPVVAWAMGWYKIPGMEVPFNHSAPPLPFTVKRIEINLNPLKSATDDPTSHLPVADPSRNPAEFNLDPNAVESAANAAAHPRNSLVPEPNKVIAATDLSQGLPFAESDAAKVSAEIARVEPTTSGGPLTSSNLAEQMISSSSGPTQPGTPAGSPATGNGTAGKLPGFAELAPNFKPSGPSLSSLPEPILLRLPSDVLFDFDSATLKPEADGLLSQAVGLITKYPEADIHIDGYTDSFGKPDYNSTLSQQRAEAVQAWLQQRIAQETYKFHSLGHGSADYVVSAQGSIEQQQPNRRVEILIQALKQ